MMQTNIPTNKKRSRLFNTKSLLIISLFIIACVGAALLGLSTHHKKTATSPTANEQTKGEPKSNPSSAGTTTQQPTTADKGTTSTTPNTPPTTTAVLVMPSGDFVSNHHPNLSGSPAPNLITSSCTTTSGAT